jgi:uncharacterized protein (DUF362 family)
MFIEHLNKKYEKDTNGKGKFKSKEEYKIAIKPNIMTASYEKDLTVYTDVDLVEYLIELIKSEGYKSISVVESQNIWSYYYENRTVEKVANMVGYRSNGYEVVDLTTTKKCYDYGDNELGMHTAGPAWRNADYRISFAKNKTHWQCFYTGCMKNVYGCLPELDKIKEYHARRHWHWHRRRRHPEFDSCTIIILEAFPVDFAFLDAYWSGDGLIGLILDKNPNKTNTIICGENCFAVDWVQGMKMDLDPTKNRVIKRAVERWGLIEIQGDGKPKTNGPRTIDVQIRCGDNTNMHPYRGWKNVPSFVPKPIDWIEEISPLFKFLGSLLACRMDPDYPPAGGFKWDICAPFRLCVKGFLDHSKAILGILFVLILIFVFLLLIGKLTLSL